MQLHDGTVFELVPVFVQNSEIPILTIRFSDGNHYRILKHLASGAYAHVFLVECLHCHEECALKVVPAPTIQVQDGNLAELRSARQAQRELWFSYFSNSLHENKPPNVVQAYWYWHVDGVAKSDFIALYKQCIKAVVKQRDNVTRRIIDLSPENSTINLYFVLMPYFPLGSLALRLAEESSAYEIKLSLFIEILRGVEFLHEKGLIHRRLCPNNIFLYTDDHSKLHAVVGGFGRIISCGENPEWRLSNTTRNFSRRHNPDLFEAPEVKGTDYDQSSDYFSIGVIALVMFWNLHTHNDIVDAILALQDEKPFNKQDNPNLPDKKFWLDIVRKQVSRKREIRYSCSTLLQMCLGHACSIRLMSSLDHADGVSGQGEAEASTSVAAIDNKQQVMTNHNMNEVEIIDILKKGRDGKNWRLLLDKLNPVQMARRLSKISDDVKAKIGNDVNKSNSEMVEYLINILERSEPGAAVEFVEELYNKNKDIFHQIFPLVDSCKLQETANVYTLTYSRTSSTD